MQYEFKIKEFEKSGEIFFTALLKELDRLDLPVRHLVADHLCFRVRTNAEYLYYKYHLQMHGRLLTEAQVNGRTICTFQLADGFKSESGQINLVELPSPKFGVDYQTGFEHAEFVLCESFKYFQDRHSTINFKQSGNKNLNPELCLQTPVGQAKFHYTSLNRVIEIENSKLTDIIFDLDGTLIQSRQQIYKINSLVFSDVCQREVTVSEAKVKFSPEFSKLFSAFAVTCPIAKDHAVSLWGEIAKNFEFPLFSGAHELLLTLQKTNLRLHLWTARDQSSSLKILRSHKIDKLFTTLSFASSAQSKPHPESLNFDCRLSDPNSVLMIGDSPSDVEGAKNINAIAAAALWDIESDPNALMSSGAELFFYNLNEFQEWIASQ